MTSDSLPRPPSSPLGWVLLMPAGLGMLITLLLPTVQTIRLSLESGGTLTPLTFVGLDNYTRLLGSGGAFWGALGFSLSLVLVPLLVALIAGPLLALALDRAGTGPRRAGLVVLSLAPVAFSPAAVAVAWMHGLTPGASGLVSLATTLRDPATAPGGLRLILGAATFGAVCALAVMAFLPALRGGAVTRSMLAVGAVVALATVAAALQTFTLTTVMTRGSRPTQTLAGVQYTEAFVQARPGMGAAVATLTGVILGVLGLAAAIIVVAVGVRLWVTPKGSALPYEPEDAPAGSGAFAVPAGASGASAPSGAHVSSGPAAGPGPGTAGHGPASAAGAFPYGAHGDPSERAPGGERPESGGRSVSAAGRAAGIAAVVVYAAVTLALTWPWLTALTGPSGGRDGGIATQVNTWVPALVGAVVSVGVAYLGALGIGGLRPLGRRSEWLLLLFAPWLFVGVGPLSVAGWNDIRNLGLIDTFVSLVPPVLVSVPCLFVLTLLCKGLAERSGGDFAGGVVRPSLPMAAVLVGVVTLLNGQDLLWPLLVAHDPGLATAPAAQFLRISEYGAAADAGLSTPLPVMLVALLAAGAAQVLYLHRLAIGAGTPRAGSGNPAPAA
ncbi:hypothetical protein [Nonomuraea sp. NPDC005501]|uniref:carbohydrate ABC transporter permease n=1 Tax=Nonomuraea sp. NPDC005501 TaxID=3156884 RepID=UPI0033B377D0